MQQSKVSLSVVYILKRFLFDVQKNEKPFKKPPIFFHLRSVACPWGTENKKSA